MHTSAHTGKPLTLLLPAPPAFQPTTAKAIRTTINTPVAVMVPPMVIGACDDHPLVGPSLMGGRPCISMGFGSTGLGNVPPAPPIGVLREAWSGAPQPFMAASAMDFSLSSGLAISDLRN